MPEFYTIFARKITFSRTFGGTPPSTSSTPVTSSGLTENAGVENVAPSSGAYLGFQVRWPEVMKSGDGSPPVESRSKPR